MNLNELNFNSFSLGMEERERFPSTKPPLQPPSSNLVDIGPFTISKLQIPDGFYTNPTQWSKSSTGSGITEHEEDSFGRPDREPKYEHFGLGNEGLRSPPFAHPTSSSLHSETDDRLSRLPLELDQNRIIQVTFNSLKLILVLFLTFFSIF
jgi:hypothetical protein